MTIHIVSDIRRKTPRQRLRRSTYLLLLTLADYANEDGICWPSIPTLAYETLVGERQVQRHLEELRDDGMIFYVPTAGGRGRTTFYCVVAHLPPDVIPSHLVERYPEYYDHVKVFCAAHGLAEPPQPVKKVKQKRVTSSPPLANQKGDIPGQKGDIPGQKGDIAVSPDPPSDPPCDPPPPAEPMQSWGGGGEGKRIHNTPAPSVQQPTPTERWLIEQSVSSAKARTFAHLDLAAVQTDWKKRMDSASRSGRPIGPGAILKAWEVSPPVAPPAKPAAPVETEEERMCRVYREIRGQNLAYAGSGGVRNG